MLRQRNWPSTDAAQLVASSQTVRASSRTSSRTVRASSRPGLDASRFKGLREVLAEANAAAAATYARDAMAATDALARHADAGGQAVELRAARGPAP